MGTRSGGALGELAEAVLSLRPLVDVLPHPVRVVPVGSRSTRSADPPDGRATAARLLDRVAERAGAPPFDVLPDGADREVGTFGRVVSERLRLADLAGRLVGDPLAPSVDHVVETTAAAGFDGLCERADVAGPDRTVLPAYAAGSGPPVVIASACGMPARLCEDWIRFLSRDHRVITWETRGLFGPDSDGYAGPTDVPTQAGDLLAVMDHFGVRCAHVVGLCGGAVVALAAAELAPDRIVSLSLWHGDFELGADAPKTAHQHNLKALMAMAAKSAASAAGVHEVLGNTMLAGTPPDLSHLVLYPYATPELLLAYCRLNGAIMGCDVRPYLTRTDRRTLVVTSEDDETAHPDGSRFVAATLPAAELLVTPTGNHLSLFHAETTLLQAAARFIDLEEP